MGLKGLLGPFIGSQFDGGTTHLLSALVPMSFIAYHLPSRSTLVAFGFVVATCLHHYPQQWQLPLASSPKGGSIFLPVTWTISSACYWLEFLSGCVSISGLTGHIFHIVPLLFVGQLLFGRYLCMHRPKPCAWSSSGAAPSLFLLLLPFLGLVYPVLLSSILRFFRCLCRCWLVISSFATWILPQEIIILTHFSFLEILLITDHMSYSFYAISVIGIFLMH